MLSSDDGATWTLCHRAGDCAGGTCAAPAMSSRVIWAGTQFVAVGQERPRPGVQTYALVLTSGDGLAWTQRAVHEVEVGMASVGMESGMGSVAWLGQALVAVGIGADGAPAAWTSSDGSEWIRRLMPGYAGQVLRDVAWGHGRFVAVGWGGTPAVLTSTDGQTWAEVPMSECGNDVMWDGVRYVAVGGSSICRSP